MTVFLSVQQVLFLHMRLVEETGGSFGIRDLGLLEAAVARPRAVFGGQELYPALTDKAAALMHSIVLNHPMVDGNKRLGVAASGLFLQFNGLLLKASNESVEAFTLRVAQGGVSIGEVAEWLEDNT